MYTFRSRKRHLYIHWSREEPQESITHINQRTGTFVGCGRASLWLTAWTNMIAPTLGTACLATEKRSGCECTSDPTFAFPIDLDECANYLDDLEAEAVGAAAASWRSGAFGLRPFQKYD